MSTPQQAPVANDLSSHNIFLANQTMGGDEAQITPQNLKKSLQDGVMKLPFTSLSQTNQRMVDLADGSWVGTTRNSLTLMGLGDSLGNRIIEQLDPMCDSAFGNIGYGLQELAWVVTGGTVVIPATNFQRRSDLWASGYVAQIQAGGVMTIGREVPGSNEPIFATDVSLYFARESGAGTVKVETSDDGGVTWTVLEASVDTNNATTDALIKTYTGLTTTKPRVIRLTGLTGNVEFIGAMMFDKSKRGSIIVRSNTGGNPLTLAVTANAEIRDAIMADIAPELIIHHYYEETAAMQSSFNTYIDQWVTSAPAADHVWMAEHEKDGTGDKEINNNPIARAKAATTPRFQVFETGYYFKSFDNLTAMGWNANDTIHLQAADGSFPAWRAVASQIFNQLNISAEFTAPKEKQTKQTTSLSTYEKKYPDASIISYKRVGPIYNFRERNAWVDPTTGLENFYETYRLNSSNPTIPLGIVKARQIGSNYRYVWQMDKDGRRRYGSDSGIIAPTARFVITEYSSTFPTLTLIHTSTSGNRYMQTWEDNTGEVASMRQGGVLNVSALETPAAYADDAAAAAAGVPVGAIYRVTGGTVAWRQV